MNQQKQTENIFETSPTPSFDSPQAVLDPIATPKQVRVVHGANSDYFDVAGKTVGNIRKSLKQVYNIPDDAVAIIDGQEQNEDFVVDDTMSIEFLKEAGVKGSK